MKTFKYKNILLIMMIFLLILLSLFYKNRMANKTETVIKIMNESTILLVVNSDYKVTNYKNLVDKNTNNSYKNKSLEIVINKIIDNSIKNNYINDNNRNITFQFITNSKKRIEIFENKISNILNKYKEKNKQEIYMVKEVASIEDIDKYSNELTNKTTASSKEIALKKALIVYEKINNYFLDNNIKTSTAKTNQEMSLFNLNLKDTEIGENSYYYVQNQRLYMYLELNFYKKQNKIVKSIYGFYFDGTNENYRETEVKNYIYND